MENPVQKAINDLNNIPLTKEHYVDKEDVHRRADEILLVLLEQLGHVKVVKAYEKAKRKVDGFWYS